MEDEGIVEHAATMGETVIGPALRGFAERHRSVGEVRGTGVFWAIELVKDRQTREPLAPYGSSSAEMNQIVAAGKERGLITFTNFNRIHVVPPCNISVEEANLGLGIIDDMLGIADSLVG